ALLVRRSIPESLEKTTALLLQYLPLLLIVPAAGIITSSEALLNDLPAIAVGLVLSLVITVPFCGWLMQMLIRRMERKQEARACRVLIWLPSGGCRWSIRCSRRA